MARDSLTLSRSTQARVSGESLSGGAIVGLRREAEGAVLKRAKAKATGQAMVDLAALIPDSPASLAQVRPGGFKKLYHGMLVQGSDVVGGTQPAFLVEKSSPQMRALVDFARDVSGKKWPTWKKIEVIQRKVQASIHFPDTPAEKKAFEALNRMYVGKSIPIGKYHELGLADCRGFAVTTQVLLQEARIESFYTYSRTFYQGIPGTDHAFNVLRNGKSLEVVDTLNPMFNKIPLQQMVGEGSQGYVFELHPALPLVFGSAS